MLQALYDPTGTPGTFFAKVRVDHQACSNLFSSNNATADSPQVSNRTQILLPPLEFAKTRPLWASEVQVAIATVALDADGQQLPDTFYPYYGSTLRKLVVPTAPSTLQSEYRPYAVVNLPNDWGSAASTAAERPESMVKEAAVPEASVMRVTAQGVREGSFMLRAWLARNATAPVRYAIVEGDVATGILAADAGPRVAILCALGNCINDSDSRMWPEGSIVATGSLVHNASAGAPQSMSVR
jgi:hypothetical protein